MKAQMEDSLREMARQHGLNLDAYETYDALVRAIEAKQALHDSQRLLRAAANRRRVP